MATLSQPGDCPNLRAIPRSRPRGRLIYAYKGNVQRHKPGDTIQIVFVDRTGVAKTAPVTLAEDPHIDVVLAEPSEAQKAFRDSWLGPRP